MPAFVSSGGSIRSDLSRDGRRGAGAPSRRRECKQSDRIIAAWAREQASWTAYQLPLGLEMLSRSSSSCVPLRDDAVVLRLGPLLRRFFPLFEDPTVSGHE